MYQRWRAECSFDIDPFWEAIQGQFSLSLCPIDHFQLSSPFCLTSTQKEQLVDFQKKKIPKILNVGQLGFAGGHPPNY